MTTYVLVRSEDHPCETVLHIIEDTDGKRGKMLVAQLCIGHDSNDHGRNPTGTAAMTMLLDHFSGEEHAEMKAYLLSRPLANKLNRKMGMDHSWTLTAAQLNDMVIDIMTNARDFIESAGERWIKEVDIIEFSGRRPRSSDSGFAEPRATVTGTERCTRCRGTGDFRTSWGLDGICYTCGGTGVRKQP